jgi:hypothetical protein
MICVMRWIVGLSSGFATVPDISIAFNVCLKPLMKRWIDLAMKLSLLRIADGTAGITGRLVTDHKFGMQFV